MYLIFTPDENGTNRAVGYSAVPYSSDTVQETVMETAESDLAVVFQDGKASGGALGGAEETIDAAIEDPLAYRDFLILEDGEIVFDDEYERDVNDEDDAE